MLLTGRSLAKSYGTRLLFSGITLGLEQGEHIGLIGANGSGKSTLLRVFAGLERPDEGELISRRQLRVSYVPQEEGLAAGRTCLDIVSDAMDAHLDEHERHLRAGIALDRAGFSDPALFTETLSGGWKKRLAIVRETAREPDLLLMDEPTNHLDIEGILWLEKLITAASFATLIVSHDRRFLQSMANRIIELGRAYPDGFLSHKGSYSEFLAKREEFLTAQQGRQRALASGVRREIEWLQRGAKARTTKAKGRIERAGEMMSELADLRQRNAQQETAKIDFTSSGRQTKKLIQMKGVSKSLGGRTLFRDLTLTLSPGARLGLLGPNGSGKSTLIRLITRQLEPDSGHIITADQLRVVVFDQHRQQLDPAQTLRRALSPHGDSVMYQGEAMHIRGWAGRFLFRNDQLDLPVGELSGGEQARVLIARLMLQPAEVLILDEPTNDLDIATLDVLQTSLEEFPGALVLVTHDRFLLDSISTEILALDGRGGAAIYAGLTQWEQSRKFAPQATTGEKKPETRTLAPSPPSARKRLNWSEQRELEGMEEAIHRAEAEVQARQSQVDQPSIAADHVKMRLACEALASAQNEVELLYARWATLEDKKS